LFARLIKPRSIERRLLLWLLIIALVPSLTVLGVASWAGSRAAHLLGASGSWSGVAESGRNLINQAEQRADPELSAAANEHREQLTESLTQASRWEFIGQRMRASLPLFFIGLAIMVAAIAILAARRMSRSVSRPIRELVEWSGMLAREEPLPVPTRREVGEVKELRALRGALRNASAEISTARARALEAERTRSWGEMARRVAHEMKNPLTPLRLASHRLASVAAERPELAEPIAVIAEETRRLEELASRFALLGRPTEGPRAEIDLADLLQRLLTSDVPETADTRLAVVSSHPFTAGDYNALTQVFRNLVRNALEATRPGERAALSIHIADEAEWLTVSLTDNGRGFGDIAPEQVFEPDFTSKAHGTGLGLAIARQIIRAHGGDIRAQPGNAGGAEFIVRLQRSAEGDNVV
jgi:nitrogen fixation/metabolism regulation signal transduction histidine kinase